MGPKNISGNEVLGSDGLRLLKTEGVVFKKNIGTEVNPHIRQLAQLDTSDSDTFRYIYYTTTDVDG